MELVSFLLLVVFTPSFYL